MVELSTRDLEVPGSSQGDATFSPRNFLGQGIHSHCSGQLSLLPNWTENEYQLRLGVKALSALVGLASNMRRLPLAPIKTAYVSLTCKLPPMSSALDTFYLYPACRLRHVKACIAVNASTSPLRELACQWDHTVLPATRHRRPFPP